MRRAILALSLLGCASGAAEPRPVPSLASSTSSALAFERIRVAWGHTTDASRPGLRRDLEAFVAAFPNDGLAPIARVYLVLCRMNPPEDWARAEALLHAMPEPPPGTAHDLYVVARARDLRHLRDADGAFDLLRPLVGKMVDATARGMLEEEVSLDALEANRSYEAIAYMDAWLRGASEESRAAVEAKVAKVLAGLPEASLMGSLRGMRAAAGGAGYGKEIQRLVAQRLASIALDRGDPTLARWLLDPGAGPAPVIAGDAGVELGELATSKRGLGNVAGRTLGLVLPTGVTGLRHEAADVARGVAWALDLPRVDLRGGDGVRLVTRDDTGEPDRLVSNLEEIAGEGAGVIVSGLDGASADAATAWAEAKGIALVVLAAPRASKPGPFTFTLGQPLEPVIRALVEAIGARGKGPIAPVVEGDAANELREGFRFDGPVAFRAPVSCDVQSVRAGEPRFPVASWAAAGVHTWLLATSPDCAADVVHEVGARAAGGQFALTLEAAGVAAKLAPGARVLAAASGIVPLGAGAPDDPREIEARKMAASFGRPPSFWTALGRDVGALARKALVTLPEDTVTLPADIAKRHADARDALAAARVSLWTTDAPGFEPAGASHAIPRAIRVIELR